MKIPFLICCFCIAFLSSSGQYNSRILIKGFILNEEHLQAVPLANIGIQRSKEHSISDRDGFFKIYIHKNDTLTITAIGYAPMLISVPSIIIKDINDTIILFLTSVSYPLKGVEVIRSSSRRDSIARIVANILTHDSLMNNYDRIYGRPKGKIYVHTDTAFLIPAIIYEGPITSLYNKFSKEGKEDVRFETFVKYSLKQKEVDEKYNKNVVKQVTNIDDADIDDFMQFCNPDRNFIINSKEYDLIVAIKKCLDEFNAQQLKRKRNPK